MVTDQDVQDDDDNDDDDDDDARDTLGHLCRQFFLPRVLESRRTTAVRRYLA